MIFVVVILKNRFDAITQPQKFLHDQNSEKYSVWSMIASAQVIAKSFPFDPFLHRKSHISQGECDSISQIATKTKQMLPFLTINCPTSPNEKYHAWNREQLSIYDPCTERPLWRVESGSSSWKSLRYGSKPMPVLAPFASRYHPHINPRTKGPAFLYLVMKPFLGSSFCHWKNTSKLLWLSISFSIFLSPSSPLSQIP